MEADTLAAIRARAEAATPGPWDYEDGILRVADPDEIVGLHVFSCCNIDDDTMTFVAHAREDIPALLAELARKDAEIARLTTVIDTFATRAAACLDTRMDGSFARMARTMEQGQFVLRDLAALAEPSAEGGSPNHRPKALRDFAASGYESTLDIPPARRGRKPSAEGGAE
jgi:hypothetical protein